MIASFLRERFGVRTRRTRDMLTGGVSLSIAQAVSIALGIVTTGLLARYLNAKEFGLWALVMSLTGVVGATDLGFGNALRNKLSSLYAQGVSADEDARLYFLSIFAMFLGLAALLTIAGVVGRAFLPWPRIFNSTDPKILSAGARLFEIGIPFFTLTQAFGIGQMGFFSYQESHWNAVFGTASKALLLVLTLACVGLGAGIVPLNVAFLSGSLAASAAAFFVFVRRRGWTLTPPSLHTAARKARDLWAKSAEFILLQLAATVYVQADLFLVSGTVGLASVGDYVLVKKLYLLFGALQFSFLMPIWSAYTEAVESRDYAWTRTTMVRAAAASAAFFGLAILVMSFFGAGIIRLWTGKVVSGRALYVLLGTAFLLQGWSNSFSVFLNSVGRLRRQIGLAALAALLLVWLAPRLARAYGVDGVCLALILSALPAAVSNPIESFAFLREREREVSESPSPAKLMAAIE
ncbi:MAG: oligosaccharide flippase family protein [Elusimicrobia bacterium]|nr:oligosaccharide flippase family protein [Elusimicrobiota bacterium]